MSTSVEWWESLARLGLATVLGGLIGLEREYDGQDAGFRTHVMLVLGAALFGLVSVAGFDEFIASSSSNVQVDVTRIAAYVAPGVGFIGGGAILKYGGRVTGITTASSLWCVAAIGVAAGVGFAVGAVAVAVLSLLFLRILQPVSDLVSRAGRTRNSAVTVTMSEGADPTPVVRVIHEVLGDRVRILQFGGAVDSIAEITTTTWEGLTGDDVDALTDRLGGIAGVRRLRYGVAAR